jgi:DNA-binding IclR family transcriptional regulator
VSQPVVTSLLRGLDVLRCFTEQRKVLGSSEIARLTKLPQPTVWRLCQTLVQAGYLTVEPPDNRLRLGLPVLTLGFAAISALDLADLVRADLQSIATSFGAAAGLTTREHLSMLCLQRFEAPNATLTVNWRIGSMVPIANSGVGWAYLSGLSDGRRTALLAEIKSEQPDLWRKMEKPFAAAMKDFARTGYVVNADVLYPGLTTVATSMLRPSDQALFVLNCTVLSATVSPDKIRREIGPAMKAATQRLSGALAKGISH